MIFTAPDAGKPVHHNEGASTRQRRRPHQRHRQLSCGCGVGGVVLGRRSGPTVCQVCCVVCSVGLVFVVLTEVAVLSLGFVAGALFAGVVAVVAFHTVALSDAVTPCALF